MQKRRRHSLSEEDRKADARRLKAIWERRQAERELTQESFAQLVEMGQAFFNHLLHGRKPLNFHWLMVLAEELDVPPEAISPVLTATLRKMIAPHSTPSAALSPGEREMLAAYRAIDTAKRPELLYWLQVLGKGLGNMPSHSVHEPNAPYNNAPRKAKRAA